METIIVVVLLLVFGCFIWVLCNLGKVSPEAMQWYAQCEEERKSRWEAMSAPAKTVSPVAPSRVIEAAATSVVTTILEDTGFADEDDPRFAGFSSPAKPKAPRKPRKASVSADVAALRKVAKQKRVIEKKAVKAYSRFDDFGEVGADEMADIRMMLGQ